MASLDQYRNAQLQPDTGRSRGTVRVQDLGHEAYLWVEQRLPWKVALEILKELKAPVLIKDAPAYRRKARPPALNTSAARLRSGARRDRKAQPLVRSPGRRGAKPLTA